LAFSRRYRLALGERDRPGPIRRFSAAVEATGHILSHQPCRPQKAINDRTAAARLAVIALSLFVNNLGSGLILPLFPFYAIGTRGPRARPRRPLRRRGNTVA